MTAVEVRPRRARSAAAVEVRRFVSAMPFMLVGLAIYGVFAVYPMLEAVHLSFFEWNGFRTSEPLFVGFDNYVRLFTQDPVFYTALRNSIIWLVLSMLIPTTLGLVLALGLNRPLFGRNILRTVFYVPAVLAPIAIATMWRWIYNPILGIVNSTLTSIGLGAWGQQWLGNPDIALYSMFVAFIWQTAGFNMVLFLAGLQSVPEELTDAALVDGANAWHRFRYVIFPALRPTTVVVVVLTIISSLKVFDLIVGMTRGGPAQSTQVLALWSYSQSFYNHNVGLGNAVATILLVISLLLVVPYLLWALREDKQ